MRKVRRLVKKCKSAKADEKVQRDTKAGEKGVKAVEKVWL